MDEPLRQMLSCSRDEALAHAQYLESTPVAGVAQAIRRSNAKLSRAKIRSVQSLGEMRTIFFQIGRVPTVSDARPFRVCEVLPLLREKACDPIMLSAIEAFIASDAVGAVDYKVTIVRDGLDLTIIDGNKRSIAFFERRRHIRDDGTIDFPVFVVDGVRL